MKKILIPLFALAASLLLTACGDEKKDESTSVPSTKVEVKDDQLNLKMDAAASDMDPEQVKAMITSLKQMVNNPELAKEQKKALEQRIKLLEAQLKTMSAAAKLD